MKKKHLKVLKSLQIGAEDKRILDGYCEASGRSRGHVAGTAIREYCETHTAADFRKIGAS